MDWSHLLKKSLTENFIFCAVILEYFFLTMEVISDYSVLLFAIFFASFETSLIGRSANFVQSLISW